MILGVFIFAAFYLPPVVLFFCTERPRYKVFSILILFWYTTAAIVATSFYYSWYYLAALHSEMEGRVWSLEIAKNRTWSIVSAFVGYWIFKTTRTWQKGYFERLRLNAPEEYEDIFN